MKMINEVWEDGWPDWADLDRYVEVERDDGRRVSGKLVCDDWFDDGEGEEIPVWAIKTEGGTEDFADHLRWRWV